MASVSQAIATNQFITRAHFLLAMASNFKQ